MRIVAAERNMSNIGLTSLLTIFHLGCVPASDLPVSKMKLAAIYPEWRRPADALPERRPDDTLSPAPRTAPKQAVKKVGFV
jgi:hypothetical protein